ncbi:hypothetical protein A1359_18365 [Methylomonas lenta]|uniref:Uncharacterized protein n=1 Tax=Methylomonas lenta TaxID=980561 RepID=A0A177MVX6_9GAMM|nr:hypothetical protein [Methylomonas lenta]OAI09752.1 hypothetical protein A1359_18365 [Methylomonas lenta]
MNTARAFLIFTLLVTVGQTVASVPLGGNRKGAGGSYDMYGCMQTNDYYVVNFAGYQVAPNQAKDSKSLPEAECIDLPATGKTQISIDLLDLDLRKKPVALKILREDGQTVAELPMAIAKQGVLSTMVDFKTAGKYQAVLMVDDTDLHTPPEVSALHIPITVALVAEQSGGQNGLLILFSIIGLIVAAAAYCVPRLLKPQSAESAHSSKF